MITFGKPMIGEEEKNAVLEVLSGNILVHGPKAKQFEEDFKKFTGSPYAISVASCTAGLHLAYFYLGIQPGDEVIVPAQTHVATVHAVLLCGGAPVFIDAESKTGNIDIKSIESKITSKTKAISIVHFLGMPVAMDQIMKIAEKHKLFVVEDCALAIGTTYKSKHAGLWGDVGVFSFYPVKHMTTAEGGMIITRHEEVAKKIERQKAFGVDRHVGERKIPGSYDVTMLGFNYRMNEIEAVIGIEQLKKTPSFLKQRSINYHYLESLLQKIDDIELLQSSYGDYQSSYYCLSIILNEKLASKRFEIMTDLKSRGVETSIYYPRPVPYFSYYQEKYKLQEGIFKEASRISERSIALSVGPHLSLEDMKKTAEELQNAINGVKTYA